MEQATSNVNVLYQQITRAFPDANLNPRNLANLSKAHVVLTPMATGLSSLRNRFSDPLKILILSQVVLSFTLPFALIPLLILTSRVSVMESFASAGRTRIAGWSAVGIIVCLNIVLLAQLALGL